MGGEVIVVLLMWTGGDLDQIVRRTQEQSHSAEIRVGHYHDASHTNQAPTTKSSPRGQSVKDAWNEVEKRGYLVFNAMLRNAIYKPQSQNPVSIMKKR